MIETRIVAHCRISPDKFPPDRFGSAEHRCPGEGGQVGADEAATTGGSLDQDKRDPFVERGQHTDGATAHEIGQGRLVELAVHRHQGYEIFHAGPQDLGLGPDPPPPATWSRSPG